MLLRHIQTDPSQMFCQKEPQPQSVGTSCMEIPQQDCHGAPSETDSPRQDADAQLPSVSGAHVTVCQMQRKLQRFFPEASAHERGCIQKEGQSMA